MPQNPKTPVNKLGNLLNDWIKKKISGAFTRSQAE
jgi:hypothetical protein